MNKNKNIYAIVIILFIIIIALLSIINITKEKKGELISLNYKEIIEKGNNKESFILVISQSTCSHCANYKPKLSIVAKKYNINIYYIDYDLENSKNQKDFLEKYNLDGSTPVTIFIKKGKQTKLFDRIEGEVSKEKTISIYKKMGFIK